jgi:hypothetical protein
VIDVTNAYGVPPEKLGNLPSSVVISQAGASLVKAFNHLSAEVLAEDPNVDGGRRVIFLSSDDQRAANKVAKLLERLGFAPVWLGRLTEGGLPVQARGNTWARLIFQDLFKKGDEGRKLLRIPRLITPGSSHPRRKAPIFGPRRRCKVRTGSSWRRKLPTLCLSAARATTFDRLRPAQAPRPAACWLLPLQSLNPLLTRATRKTSLIQDRVLG